MPQRDRCPQNKAVLLKPQDVKEKKSAALFGVLRVLQNKFCELSLQSLNYVRTVATRKISDEIH